MLVINEPAEAFSPISILVAARNEEANIVACLHAINQLDYPAHALDVLIGNDKSTDQTEALIRAFIADKPHFQLINISENIAGLVGKANVLAQLAQQARGQFFFFTDADTQVPANWIAEIKNQFTNRVGVVTGVTLPNGSTIFDKLQTIDWLYNLTLTHLMSSLGIPITAMGNNMAVSCSAYKQVGGYESLPFSVVEDYALFKAIIKKDFAFKNLLAKQVLAETKPVDTLRQWIQQRKRWMKGALDLPFWMVGILFAQYLTAPLLLVLGWFYPVLAIWLYVVRLFMQTTVLSFGFSRLQRTDLWQYALLFEIYQLVLGPIAVFSYWLSGSISWKGRNF